MIKKITDLETTVNNAVVVIDDYLENGGSPSKAGQMLQSIADEYGDHSAVIFVNKMVDRGQFPKVVEMCREYDSFHSTPLFLAINPDQASLAIRKWESYLTDIKERWWDRMMSFLAGILFFNGEVRHDIRDYFESFLVDEAATNISKMLLYAGQRSNVISLALHGDFSHSYTDDDLRKKNYVVGNFDTMYSSLSDCFLNSEECDDNSYLEFIYQMRMNNSDLFLIIVKNLFSMEYPWDDSGE